MVIKSSQKIFNLRKWVETAIMMLFVVILLVLGLTITKLIGLSLTIIGFALLLYFPDSYRFQPEHMTMAGILFGSFILILGIILITFG